MVHLIFSPCQFYRQSGQLEAILQLTCLWCFDRKRFAFCVPAVSFKHRENSRMGYLWKRLLIAKESKQQMLNSALHLVKNVFGDYYSCHFRPPGDIVYTDRPLNKTQLCTVSFSNVCFFFKKRGGRKDLRWRDRFCSIFGTFLRTCLF